MQSKQEFRTTNLDQYSGGVDALSDSLILCTTLCLTSTYWIWLALGNKHELNTGTTFFDPDNHFFVLHPEYRTVTDGGR